LGQMDAVRFRAEYFQEGVTKYGHFHADGQDLSSMQRTIPKLVSD
jgi:hypothetical protein